MPCATDSRTHLLSCGNTDSVARNAPAFGSLRSTSGAATPTVLLGWELGGGLGHAQRLVRLAGALASEACRPILAVRNLVDPWPALRDASFPTLQAPMWQSQSFSSRP